MKIDEQEKEILSTALVVLTGKILKEKIDKEPDKVTKNVHFLNQIAKLHEKVFNYENE